MNISPEFIIVYLFVKNDLIEIFINTQNGDIV